MADRVRSRGLAAHPVLGADTEVVVDGEMLGKPRDRTHARQMLARLAGLTPDPAERPTARQLKARIRAVDAELARAKAIKPARPKPQ